MSSYDPDSDTQEFLPEASTDSLEKFESLENLLTQVQSIQRLYVWLNAYFGDVQEAGGIAPEKIRDLPLRYTDFDSSRGVKRGSIAIAPLNGFYTDLLEDDLTPESNGDYYKLYEHQDGSTLKAKDIQSMFEAARVYGTKRQGFSVRYAFLGFKVVNGNLIPIRIEFYRMPEIYNLNQKEGANAVFKKLESLGLTKILMLKLIRKKD